MTPAVTRATKIKRMSGHWLVGFETQLGVHIPPAGQKGVKWWPQENIFTPTVVEPTEYTLGLACQSREYTRTPFLMALDQPIHTHKTKLSTVHG